MADFLGGGGGGKVSKGYEMSKCQRVTLEFLPFMLFNKYSEYCCMMLLGIT